LDFRILDASAFYAGVPFRSSNDYYTSSLAYDEIKHIKKNYDALGTLLETNRLKIREPDKEEIISDDFAISNVAKNLGLKISPIMTQGIKDVGKWVHYCPGCRTNHTNKKECPMCGTPLKRKLLKE
jgi:UPF0271 protein